MFKLRYSNTSAGSPFSASSEDNDDKYSLKGRDDGDKDDDGDNHGDSQGHGDKDGDNYRDVIVG